MQIPPDRRTTAQKLKASFELMERAQREEAFIIVSQYARSVSLYLDELERDVRNFEFLDNYVIEE